MFPRGKELLHFPSFPMVLLLEQSVPLLLSYYLESIITDESNLIMTTRQTGGLSQGYKPKLPASA